MIYPTANRRTARILAGRASAFAELYGSEAFPRIRGRVELFRLQEGVLLTARVSGLPEQTAEGASVFGFHIHAGESCTGNADDHFADALTHYNPEGTEHPRHAGDLPPLFAFGGEAYQAVWLGDIEVSEVLGKAVIIHADRDDLSSQPAGNAGKKIACWIIRRN